MSAKAGRLDAEELRRILAYDPRTGNLVWKHKCGRGRNTMMPGDIAGSINAGGYRMIRIRGLQYYGHRLAWLHYHGFWPTNQIDHRDRCRSNNAISNLRQATQSQNSQNAGAHSDSLSGVKGIYLHKPSGLWHATIMTLGVKRSLGYFHSPEDAHAAYAAAAHSDHGNFARTE